MVRVHHVMRVRIKLHADPLDLETQTGKLNACWDRDFDPGVCSPKVALRYVFIQHCATQKIQEFKGTPLQLAESLLTPLVQFFELGKHWSEAHHMQLKMTRTHSEFGERKNLWQFLWDNSAVR